MQGKNICKYVCKAKQNKTKQIKTKTNENKSKNKKPHYLLSPGYLESDRNFQICATKKMYTKFA